MTAAHTPVPWAVYAWGGKIGVTHPEGDICAMPPKGANSKRSREEDKANADFIALAVNAYAKNQETIRELVKACKAFVNGNMHDDKVIRLARLAIAKAEKEGEKE